MVGPWAEVVASIDPDPDKERLNLVVADLDPERFIARRASIARPVGQTS